MADPSRGAGPTNVVSAADKRRQLLRKLMREQGIARADAGDGAAHAPIPRRAAGLDRLPQSFAQQRLWFLDRLAPGNPFYTVSLAIPIRSAVDVPALQRALDDLIRRHEALRTTFSECDGQTVQRIVPPAPAALDRVDLTALPVARREAEAERLADGENARSFDLETGPLMVARLLTLAATEHRLLLTLHHIVCDGWSLRVLSQELIALYTAHATCRLPTLPELPIQYADFALWQRARMDGNGLDEQLAYWRRRLAGAPELHLLPDRARPAIPSFRGGLVPLSIGAAEAAAITRLGSATNATPFVVLMAAYMVLLGRLSGQDDFVVGTPIANRTRPELEPLIGFFVNTLVLRAELAGGPTFRAVVARVGAAALDAFANQDLPFERLVEEMAPQRVLGRNPLFQVIFQLFSAPDGATGEATPAARQRGTAKFDLRLDLWPTRDGGYAGELEYSDDVFEAASARRIAGQFRTLLTALLAAPDRPIDDANAMDEGERRFVVDTLNATAAPYPADVGIDRLFRDVARAHGDVTAVRFADGEFRYAQLDAASDAMACRLAQRGVQAGDTVGVLLERSAAMVVAWLGVLKLGAAYVPLDVEQPPARLAAMLADAGTRVVVSAQGPLRLLQGVEVAIERIDVARDAPPVAWPVVAGGDVAHVIFTSGSTGRPKGVRIPHRGIARLTQGADWVDFRPGDHVGQTSNPAFDATTYEVWSALLNGCTLVEIDRDTVLSAPALAARLADERFDHLFLTTALFTRHAAERPGMFAPLHSLMTGGAKAEVQSFRAVLAAGPPTRLFNAYGQTETTVLGSVWTAQALPADALTVPIGRPVTNTTCYVLDARRQPVPIGAPGQLYIGGPGVALGYVGRPELTAQRFVADPWRDDGTLYASGDKVRWRHDGQLEFLGRFDDQIKIRGFRVEPDEIAAVLSGHPAVRSAVVVARERRGEATLEGEQSLAAYVELHEDLGAAFDAAALTGAADELVAHWRSLYDTVLYDSPAARPTFNTSGWNDTATGAPIPEADMDEQVTQTVERALATGAKRVLEIGCGTGLLLFRIAPHCERYVGTDLSAVAIDHVRRTAAALPEMSHVELFVGTATNLSAIPAGEFDLVLLNSVVQYFPSFDYLVEVVQAAAARLAPGAVLYLGDVRHQGLLHAFHADVLLARAADDAPLSGLSAELTRRLDEEQELALAPAALQVLRQRVPGFGLPRIELKRGTRHNELNRFRFDAMLTWNETHSVPVRPTAYHWERDLGASFATFRSACSSTDSAALRINGVANARVTRAQRAARALDAGPASDVAALRPGLDATLAASADPEMFWALGAELGRPVRVLWNALDDAAFDVVILPPAAADAVIEDWPDARAALPLAELVTTPLRGHFTRQLVPALKAHVAARLPAYMWPDNYVRLKQLPLSPNGKIDKAALPTPERLRPELRAACEAARSDTERRLADIWARLLDVDAPSVHDHFFNDLGGHSLLATQVMSRVRSEFGADLPLRVIFEGPTIAELAQAVDAVCASGRAAAPAAPIAGDGLAGLDVDTLDEAALDAALARIAPEAS